MSTKQKSAKNGSNAEAGRGKQGNSSKSSRAAWLSGVLIAVTVLLLVAASFTYGAYRGAQMDMHVEPLVMTIPEKPLATLCAGAAQELCALSSRGGGAHENLDGEDSSVGNSTNVSESEDALETSNTSESGKQDAQKESGNLDNAVSRDEIPCLFLGSKNGSKYYPPNCSALSRINPENLICFESVDDATQRGYSASKSCQ